MLWSLWGSPAEPIGEPAEKRQRASKCEGPAGRWANSWRKEDAPARQEKADHALQAVSALPVGGEHLGKVFLLQGGQLGEEGLEGKDRNATYITPHVYA